MLALLLPIGALLAGVALLLLGSGLLGTLLPLRGSFEGFDDQVLGYMGSAYFAGFFLGAYVAPPLIQRIGHIRAFAFFAAVAACAVLIHPLEIAPTTWVLLRLVVGTALVSLYMVIESWLNSHAPQSHRGQIFAVYMVVNLGALAAAQQLLRLGQVEGFALFSVSAILFCASLLPIASTRLPQPSLARARPYSPRHLWRLAPAAAAGAVMSGLAMGAFWGLGPVYAGHMGLDAHGVAVFMSTAIVGGALFQWPIGRFSDLADRRRVLALSALAACGAALLMAALGYAGSLVLLAALVYGGLAFAIYPIAIAHLMDHLDPGESLGGGGGLLLVHGIGASIGPAVAGLAMSHLGAIALPLYFALMQGLLALFTLTQTRRRSDEVTAPAAFMPMLRTSPTVLAMMPEQTDAAAATPAATNEGKEMFKQA